ncbi:lanthionine synthetase C family protein [Streptomyces catenulae]|uniref:Lanthionine synthetase C family protein n=1 Tax=Streptomyces catenulae TaxID=66875 RepID=A0ABV2YXH8_9ACTN|nr:lanthionine synthetase C family protein [Streptomyces catenulae]
MTPPPPPDPRPRAAEVAYEVAGRLAVPERLAEDLPELAPLGLDQGYPALALLHAELSHGRPEFRRAAHAHLGAAAARVSGRTVQALYHGIPALALAAHAARRTPDDYAALLTRLDTALDRIVDRALEPERARLDAGRPGVPFARYDLISGVAGLARLLLLRRETHEDALAAALGHLVRLTRPLTRDGAPVPGWWSPDGPRTPGAADPGYPHGHVNFGLAHGIGGPLAVLSAALRDGVPVPGLRSAVTALTRELLAHRTEAGGWPALIPLERYGTEPPAPGRTAWCYGTPGTAAALHRAGRALGDTGLCALAADALADDLDRPRGITDHAFCHGHAGLLHLCHTLTEETPHPRLTAHRDALATRLVTAYDPELPYGFPDTAAPADTGAPAGPGLLTGAAGIALALHAYATDAPPRTPWDAAFLLR